MTIQKPKTPIRLLALDLDGTLLTQDKRFTERTKAALLSAVNAGIEPVFVTGRPYYGLPAELDFLSGIRYVITSNGAVTYDLQKKKRLRSALIDKETAVRIAHLPADRQLMYNVFLDGIGYCDKEVYEQMLQHFSGTPVEQYVRQSRRPTDDLTRRILQAEEGIENIWIRASSREERDHLNALITESGPLKTVLTAETDVEVGSHNADKGIALQKLADVLQINQNSILSIGDNVNDIGMFQVSGISVAMGNASEEVKQHAYAVTGTNNADGAAAAIEKFCL